jgi:hypothetical protein
MMDAAAAFAVALRQGTQIDAIVRLDLPYRFPILRFEVASGSGF